MTLQDQFRIYDKALRVLASCETVEHFEVTRKFVDLAIARLEECETNHECFAREAMNELRYKLGETERKIKPAQQNQYNPYLNARVWHQEMPGRFNQWQGGLTQYSDWTDFCGQVAHTSNPFTSHG